MGATLLTGLIVFAVGMFVMLRNLIVFHTRIRAINQIYDHNMALIDARRYGDRIDFDVEAGMGYHAAIFDLTKWTYRGFFPRLHGMVVSGNSQENASLK